MQITVVGAGYVGLSLATLLGQKHEVIVLDIDEEKVATLRGSCLLQDKRHDSLGCHDRDV